MSAHTPECLAEFDAAIDKVLRRFVKAFHSAKKENEIAANQLVLEVLARHVRVNREKTFSAEMLAEFERDVKEYSKRIQVVCT